MRIAIVFQRIDGAEREFSFPIGNGAQPSSKEVALAIREACQFLGVTPREAFQAVSWAVDRGMDTLNSARFANGQGYVEW